MAQVSNFFVGANSGEGFQNLFPELVNLEDTYDLMVLKGGPGVGKNTFMRELVLRGPGFPGRRGPPGDSLRGCGRHVTPRRGTPVSGGGGPLCGPGAVLRSDRCQSSRQ